MSTRVDALYYRLRSVPSLLVLAGLCCLCAAAQSGAPAAGANGSKTPILASAVAPSHPGNHATGQAESGAAAQEGVTARKRGMGDGVAVHGHWVIEVKNPNGTVTARREFENALQPSGAQLLSTMLAVFSRTPGGFSIALNGASDTYGSSNINKGNLLVPTFTEAGPCLPLSGTTSAGVTFSTGGPSTGTTCLITGQPILSGGFGPAIYYPCYLAQVAANSGANQPCSTNLTVPVFGSGSITLTGSVVATGKSSGAATVNDVETLITSCNATTTSNACFNAINPQGQTNSQDTTGNIAADQLELFTEKILNGASGTPTAPVPYSIGQTIQVTVTLTFSSGS